MMITSLLFCFFFKYFFEFLGVIKTFSLYKKNNILHLIKIFVNLFAVDQCDPAAFEVLQHSGAWQCSYLNLLFLFLTQTKKKVKWNKIIFNTSKKSKGCVHFRIFRTTILPPPPLEPLFSNEYNFFSIRRILRLKKYAMPLLIIFDTKKFEVYFVCFPAKSHFFVLHM